MTLLLTMGDPAGIGGELTLKAWAALRATGQAFAVLADPEHLRSIDPSVPLRILHSPAEAPGAFADALPVLPLALPRRAVAGQPDTANAPAVIASIEQAVGYAMRREVAGIVTNPIAKHVLHAAGFKFPGHTELLGALTGSDHPVMMLANQWLRVVPVTLHVSLRDAVASLTTERIMLVAHTVAHALRGHGVPRARLAVAGLNPHAGENGSMGTEEETIIAPAIARLCAEGLVVTGPHSPDTLFTYGARAGYDVAVCMYHDQALIPLKTIDMDSGVNVTLGLPIVRTSPDHGTAFDIAGRGVANPASLLAAIQMAHDLSTRGQGPGQGRGAGA